MKSIQLSRSNPGLKTAAGSPVLATVDGQPPAGGQQRPDTLQQAALQGGQWHYIRGPAQQLDVRMSTDYPGCGARRVQQDTIKRSLVPPGRRFGGVALDVDDLAGDVETLEARRTGRHGENPHWRLHIERLDRLRQLGEPNEGC